ncbi:MAG: hypothetical protein WAQ28_13000 [Bacteroidia bacterium]
MTNKNSKRNALIQVKETPEKAYGFDYIDEHTIVFSTGRIQFTVMGFMVNSPFDMLIVTIKVALIPHVNDEQVHLKKIDLFNTDALNIYCRTAATQLKTEEAEIKSAIYTLRERLSKYKQAELKMVVETTRQLALSTQEQKEAMEYLEVDNLLDIVEAMLEQAGIATEKEKALLLFFILLSRYFEKPLNVFLQGSPQLCKMLMDVVGDCVPNEQIHSFTSMSTNSFYYMQSKNNMKNTVLYITNLNKHFKGANTLKELIENGILKYGTTESNLQTGRVYASKKVVEGNICLMTYSNDETINKKFSEECFFIRVNETEKNKTEMLDYMKKQYGGMIDIRQQQDAIRKLRNIQRLIRPVHVVIPYALNIELPTTVNQQLRSMPQLLTFVKCVTILHQHLLPPKVDGYGVEYIESTPEHLQIALGLFKNVIVTQHDILTQTQRNLLEGLKKHIKDQKKTFRIPDAMKIVGIYGTSFYKEFNSLKALGYVKPCGGNRKRGMEYQIVEWEDYNELESEVNNWSNQKPKISLPSLPKFTKKHNRRKVQ